MFKFDRKFTPPNDFIQACVTGNLDEVEARLKSGEDVNQIDETQEGLAPHIRSDMDFLAMYKDGKGPSTWGLGAVHIAMMKHDLPLLILLVKYDADIYLSSKQGPPPGWTGLETGARAGFLPGF